MRALDAALAEEGRALSRSSQFRRRINLEGKFLLARGLIDSERTDVKLRDFVGKAKKDCRRWNTAIGGEDSIYTYIFTNCSFPNL